MNTAVKRRREGDAYLRLNIAAKRLKEECEGDACPLCAPILEAQLKDHYDDLDLFGAIITADRKEYNGDIEEYGNIINALSNQVRERHFKYKNEKYYSRSLEQKIDELPKNVKEIREVLTKTVNELREVQK